jgi:hypothetical protein
MPTYRPTMTALVAGLPTTITESHTHDAVNEVGTCSLVLALPAPAHVVPNAVVEVVATMTNVATGASESATIFQGQCRGPVRDVLTIAGATKTLQAQGWLALMDLPHHEDVAFSGPIPAHEVIRGLFQDRGFGEPNRPTFTVDILLTPDLGDVIELGGEPLSDDGQVRVPAGRSESYFGFIARLCRLFGYAVYERAGAPRVSRILGAPSAASVKTFTEGTESFEWEKIEDLHEVVTWWEVRGASWRDEDGTETAIRSFPASVPASADIPDPPSATRGDEADSLLVTQALADAVRNVREIEFGVRRQLVRWSVRGQPLIRPGQVVTLSAPTVGVSGDVWVYSVDHDYTADGGYVTRFSGSFGGGEALPSGADVCVTETLLTGPTHVGDETIAWYAVDAPTGSTITVNFTPLDDYTSITLTGRHHGTNSQFIDSQNTDLTVSRFQLWQGGVQIGEGAMPVADENYALQLDYTDDANWSDFAVPIPGTLEGGVAAELRIISGKNPALPPETDDDDFEVKNIVLTSCAQGSPTLPTEPTSPTIPPPQPPAAVCLATLSGAVPVGSSNRLVFPSFAIPAGAVGIRVRGVASGLIDKSFAAGNPSCESPCHSLAGTDVGLAFAPLYVPGTQTFGETNDCDATIRTGGGTFEVLVQVAGPVAVVDNLAFVSRPPNTELGGGVAFAVSDACVTAIF